MDVILVEGDGTGLEGGGRRAGTARFARCRRAQTAQRVDRTAENVKQVDPNVGRPPAEKPPEL